MEKEEALRATREGNVKKEKESKIKDGRASLFSGNWTTCLRP